MFNGGKDNEWSNPGPLVRLHKTWALTPNSDFSVKKEVHGQPPTKGKRALAPQLIIAMLPKDWPRRGHKRGGADHEGPWTTFTHHSSQRKIWRESGGGLGRNSKRVDVTGVVLLNQGKFLGRETASGKTLHLSTHIFGHTTLKTRTRNRGAGSRQVENGLLTYPGGDRRAKKPTG